MRSKKTIWCPNKSFFGVLMRRAWVIRTKKSWTLIKRLNLVTRTKIMELHNKPSTTKIWINHWIQVRITTSTRIASNCHLSLTRPKTDKIGHHQYRAVRYSSQVLSKGRWTSPAAISPNYLVCQVFKRKLTILGVLLSIGALIKSNQRWRVRKSLNRFWIRIMITTYPSFWQRLIKTGRENQTSFLSAPETKYFTITK